MRFVAALAIVVLGGPALAAAPTGKVRLVRRDMVYVDLGRAQGVRVGDVLKATGGAELKVVELGEKQLVAQPEGDRSVRVGATVTAPRAPSADASDAKRPVVALATPGAAKPRPWPQTPSGRATLVPSPKQALRDKPKATGVHGELLVTYAGMLDAGVNDLDLHQVELRSKLAVGDPAGGGLDYRHDVAVRAELGPNLDGRQGANSRPYYKIRELALRYRSDAWHDSAAESPYGAFDGSIGRIRLPESPSTGLIDGVRAELALGHGFSAGVHGGLAPELLDTALSTDLAVAGAHASWAQMNDDWRARATLTTVTSFWRGALNRLDVGANGGVSWGRDLDLYAAAVGTLVDDTLMPGGQPALSLSRGFFGARMRPVDWLSVDAHYAHDQIVVDREWVARLGTDRAVVDPRESAWLQIAFAPDPAFTLQLSGNLGFGATNAEQQGGAGRVTLRGLVLDASRLALGYRFTQTPSVRAQVADVDLGIPLGDVLELGLGYQFATFQTRLLDERQDEHRVEAGLDLLAAGPWRVSARAAVAFGHLPSQIALTALFGWRFP